MEGDEPTQATQNVLDPRRVGKQNSGFSDEDISDIICVLYPYSDSAREELKRLAAEDSPHIIGKDEADGVEPDYAHEDYADRFETHTVNSGNHAIILRLSAQLKSPTAGYAFGRNHGRCDLVFINDPRRRISNIHFRVYVNEYGSVMIEDQSTNGTWVDRQLLTSRPHNNTARAEPPITRWVLSSGAIIRIYLHEETQDLAFRVRIPRRDDEYDQAYTNKVDEFFARNGIKKQNETITPGPAGHVDLFRAPIQAPPLHPHPLAQDETTQQNHSRSPSRRREPQHHPREWTGSGKYNRTGMIGRGAFAVVHKVTSKYDGKPYAAKELEKRKFIKNGILDQKVENEMRIMKRITHPNIVKYIENFDWDDRLLIIIMEFIPGGDLGKFISEQGPLSEIETRSMSRQLSNALGYLHANNITHRDVKPDNILINSYDPIDVKLTDFGLSKMVDSEQTFLRTFCGTLLYCAPEVYTEYAEYDENGVRSRGKKVRRMPGQRYNHAVDIWSLGGVLFYAMTGSPPYPVKSGISYSELLHKIMTTPLNITPLQRYHISDAGIDFLRRMLRNRPERRATIADIVAHPWSGNTESTIVASQSYDEITDDEDMVGDLSQFQPQHEFDRVSDSMGEESEKENYPEVPDTQAPRLFGEVGISAIGSSGVIPEDFLNLPADHPNLDDSDVLGSDMDEAYQSDEPKPHQGGSRRTYRQTSASIAQHQSDDQLQSLVEEVASQSLGGNESVVHNLAVPGSAMQSMEFNTSKRKPHPTDTSDEFDENTPPGKPIFKRLKSEGNIDALSNEAVEEYKLLAQIQKAVPGTGRQIEGPASKRVYWEPDRATWHLNYPEMMLSQWNAFTRTATLRNELFCPGKSPLWDLAMKYFPPTSRKGELKRRAQATFRTAPSGLDDRMVIDTMDFPATAPPVESQPIPDTLPSDTGIIVPMADEVAPKRLVGIVESHPDSCITDISFNITDSLVSFGRGLENTICYQPKTESRVPKFAMKILLWRDDNEYDPKDTPHPWSKDISEDPNSYSFYISTKATSGISINGYILPSTDAKTPGGPSRYWTRLYNGDEILLWGKPEPSKSTLVTFKCFWGGSSRARGENKALQTVDASLAQKLDAASRRTEKRIERTAERHAKEEEAELELELRKEYIENERERSRNFELKRQEAISFFNSRPLEGSRRGSPASAPPTSRMRNGQFSRANSANDAGLSIL